MEKVMEVACAELHIALWLISYIPARTDGLISISLGLGSGAVHQGINQKTEKGPEQSEEVSSRCTTSHLKESAQTRHSEGVSAWNTLIKTNADISQVDGMFGTVYNTQSINNMSTCRCIKVRALMKRGEEMKRATDRMNDCTVDCQFTLKMR